MGNLLRRHVGQENLDQHTVHRHPEDDIARASVLRYELSAEPNRNAVIVDIQKEVITILVSWRSNCHDALRSVWHIQAPVADIKFVTPNNGHLSNT